MRRLALSLLLIPHAALASTTITGGNIINQTWTLAGSPYIVQGDVTIPEGSTLTIEAGVAVQLPGGDLQASGISTTKVELVVRGVLNVQGTAAAPVTFDAPAASHWYGILLRGASTSTLDHLILRNGDTALTYAATGSALAGFGIDIEAPTSAGVRVESGTPTFDGVIVRNSGSDAIDVAAGSPTFANCLVQHAARRGIEAVGSLNDGPGVVTITSCTVDHTNAEGIFNFVSTGGHSGTMTVANTIVTNSGAGIAGGQVTGDYCDVWNNAANLGVGISCPHCMSANPQYVAAEDLHLQASSIAIDVAPSGPPRDLDDHARPFDGNGIGGAQWDLGAYEYGAMASGDDGGVGTGGDGGIPDEDAATGGHEGGGSGGRGGCCQTGSDPRAASLLALALVALWRRRR